MTLPGVTLPGVTVPRVTIPRVTLPKTTTTAPTTSTTIEPTTTTTTTAPPIGPHAVNDAHLTVLGLLTNIPVLTNDTTGSSALDSSTLRIVSGPGSGTASVSAGTIRFMTPGLVFLGTSLTYEICDTNGLCDRATVAIAL